jgi:hypothetical protein
MLSAPMEVPATEKSESSYDLNYQKLFFEDPLELVNIYDMIAGEMDFNTKHDQWNDL